MRTRTDGLSQARSILLLVLSIEVAVLVVTGVVLVFVYRPTTGQAWNAVFTASYDWGERFAHGLRLVHRLASGLAIITAIATGLVVALHERAAVRRWPGAVVGAGIAVTTIAAWFTGFLLPWDQLALRAVTVGTNFTGFGKLFGDEVKFVLIGGAEVSPGTVVGWLLVHMLVLGPVLVGLVVVAWRRQRATEEGQMREDNLVPGPV